MEEKQQHGRWKYLMCIWFGIFCFPLIAIAAQGVIKVKGYFSEVQAIRLQSPNQKIPDRKTKCVIKTHINIKQNVIFGAKLKPV